MNDNNVVSLPPDFDGVFRFTNRTDTEFKAKWNNLEYTFPPLKTTPMVIMGASPEQTQYIRKKFARELAEREYYKSDKLKKVERETGILNSIHQAPTYSDTDLKEFIQSCLEPLPIAQAKITKSPAKEIHQTTDESGNARSVVVDQKKSLIGEGTVIG